MVLANLTKPKIARKQISQAKNIAREVAKENQPVIELEPAKKQEIEPELQPSANKQTIINQRRIINEQKRLIELLEKEKTKNQKIEAFQSKNAGSSGNDANNLPSVSDRPKSVSKNIRTDEKSTTFYQTMQEKAKSRNERIKKMQEERKQRQLEQGLERQSKLEQEKIKLEEEKKLAAKQRLEEIKREREKMKLKKINQQVYQENCLIAEKFYIENLKKRVVRKMRAMVEVGRKNELKAEKFYRESRKRQVIDAWRNLVEESLEKKYQDMRKYYQTKLIAFCFNFWKDVNRRNEIVDFQANRHYERTLRIGFTLW